MGSNQNETKLVLTLQDKKNYVVHYRNLQFYLKEGMILQTLEFDQECWMRTYNRMNTEFRKQATNEFEKNFCKLMNNSVFGKTMENVQKRDNIKIVRTDKREKIRTLIASPLFAGCTPFSNDLAGFDMHKESVKQDKPFYAGMTIFHNTKILMNDFYCNELKRQYDLNFELIYTDTDSLLLEVQTNEVYKDMEGSKHLHDTSDYPKDHPFYSSTNQTVKGKMKDEMNGMPITEYVCLQPKMYSILTEAKNIKNSKGTKKYDVKKEIRHVHYKEAFSPKKPSGTK